MDNMDRDEKREEKRRRENKMTNDKMEEVFFHHDRQHSRPKRIMLKNMLNSIMPFYWRSKRKRKLIRDSIELQMPEDEDADDGNAESVAEGASTPNQQRLDAEEPTTSTQAHGANSLEHSDNEETNNEQVDQENAGIENTGPDQAPVGGDRHAELLEKLRKKNEYVNSRYLEAAKGSASLYYLDAFSGSGKYQGEVAQSKEGDVTDFGSPIIAVETAIRCLSTQFQTFELQGMFYGHDYVVHFIFNEKDRGNLDSLKTLVEERFRLHEWTVESRTVQDENRNGMEEKVVFRGDVATKDDALDLKFRILVEFRNREFVKLDLENIPTPLFSFIDPFGIRQIPMDAVKKIIGPDQEIFLNLMVGTINRRIGQPGPAVELLFAYDPFQGDEEGLQRPVEGETSEQLCERLRRIADKYFDTLNEEFRKIDDVSGKYPWRDGYLHTKFAVRKGFETKLKGTIYFMGFASAKLNFIHIAKQAMMKVTDGPDELYFSAFHRRPGADIPEYVRKTDDNYEATVIWNTLDIKGQTIKLGQLRKRILLETPFVYHSRPLAILEKDLRIVHVDTTQEMRMVGEVNTRNLGNFCATSTPLSATQLNSRGKRYGNDWEITFSNDAVYAETREFLRDQKNNASLFINWLKLKIQVETWEMNLITYRDLKKLMLNTKDIKITMTSLRRALELMVERGIAEVHPAGKINSIRDTSEVRLYDERIPTQNSE